LTLTRNPAACYASAFDEAKATAEDGSRVVVAHSGITINGFIGATTAMILEEAPAKVQGLSMPPEVPFSMWSRSAMAATSPCLTVPHPSTDFVGPPALSDCTRKLPLMNRKK